MDRAGALREQITIRQTTSTTADASGARIPTIVEIGPIYAAVKFRPIGSDEKEIASQNTAITTVHFTIRNSPERVISATDEVVYRGKVYAIRSVIDKDVHRFYLLLETEQMGETQII
jgi:SPP1 family predicted phage head-tail adaptor